MASCVLCGVDIRWVDIEGKRVALNLHEVGPGQERVAEHDGVWVTVAAGANVTAFTRHRDTCPYTS